MAACSALGGPRPWPSRPGWLPPAPPATTTQTSRSAPARHIPALVLIGLATVTGCVGGIYGIAGGYLGARMQSQLPDILIRRIVGVLAVAIAAQFLRNGLSSVPAGVR